MPRLQSLISVSTNSGNPFLCGPERFPHLERVGLRCDVTQSSLQQRCSLVNASRHPYLADFQLFPARMPGQLSCLSGATQRAANVTVYTKDVLLF